ncbi:MAG: ribose 5-phosphate isomerase B [Phycisphaeraceae bacterium]|nr:ribose 5-phosphate isomerase B [Phycisphaeraceae bacterium]MCP4067512.1 ribose 5-phosphate isomerase B [Phycisphaeraceae bacterium]MCP4939654.1 ribose 5-phosphate isomerase B [Phycisphaeraceae bacterium]
MKIAIGSDHAGFELKESLRVFIESLGHEIIDVGTDSTESVDYPDYAEKVAVEIITGRADRGVMLCGSGVGASVAANKVPGIRAANCEDYYSAHQGVEHDDMNILVLGGRIVGSALAEDMVRGYLAASYTGEPRHVRRLEKVLAIEARGDEYRAMRP